MLGFIFIFKEENPKANNGFNGVLPVQFPAGLGEQSTEMKSALIDGKVRFAISSYKPLMIFLLMQELSSVSNRDGLCS